MYNEGFDQWSKMSKNLNTPLNDLNKATTALYKRLSEKNMELIEANFARFSSQLKRLSSVRKPEEFFNLQKECLTENISASVESTQKIVQITMEAMEELSKIWGSSAAKVSEKAVEKAQKFAHRAEKTVERAAEKEEK